MRTAKAATLSTLVNSATPEVTVAQVIPGISFQEIHNKVGRASFMEAAMLPYVQKDTLFSGKTGRQIMAIFSPKLPDGSYDNTFDLGKISNQEARHAITFFKQAYIAHASAMTAEKTLAYQILRGEIVSASEEDTAQAIKVSERIKAAQLRQIGNTSLSF